MRRSLAAGVGVLACGLAASAAFAQQVNQYAVQGSVSPNRGATKAKPLPVQLKFAFQVKEAAGQRPSPIKTYAIGFYGGHSNGALFPKCTAAQINAAQSDRRCPRGSKVGSGFVRNIAGATSDPSDQSLKCDLKLTIYNAGANRAALYLAGDPPDCVIPIHQALDARYVSAFGGKGQALEFSVPDNLLHPVAGLDNSQIDVTSTIDRVTRRVRGRTRGYLEINQRCPRSRTAPIQVEFTSEAGQRETTKSTVRCRP
ncbi:MAG TPA: hypothetical protein VNZ62_03365 [Capillimicrobium sp.]|nr:hypothetical protein [Capillimicrobium sp.]